ncbi:hypothetical protein Cni_G17399 [Canna indica]|uniref:Uncharacterized protein n=1 Tax=Canna indica TaxID=4628 RepID=A0AAQ3QDJ5_9LILI|nr:hypothetical protein Cni_G17399 [Canna indica]
MVSKVRELEDRLREVGSRLESPPSSVDELLTILDHTESLLSKVDQSPTQSMSNALRPSMRALVAKELLGHSDMDVKVAVASCFSEITRITAPETPYEDNLMKEIFQSIVQAFENLDDMSSRSFPKRVAILETVAKVRSCVVMLDLECDALILEMFRHFLKTIRPNHSDKIFSSMEMIMTLVLEESEDISSELILCLLDSIKNDNKDILPVARRLGEKVISNCDAKLKPYLLELSQSAGISLNDYGKVVASICQERPGGMQQLDINASDEDMADESKQSERATSDELLQGSSKMEPQVGRPETPEKSPKSMMSNGTMQMGNGESVAEPSSPEQKPESSVDGDQAKMGAAADREVSDNMESASLQPEAVPDPVAKKIRDSGTEKDPSPQAEVPSATRQKRGRSRSKVGTTGHEDTAVTGESVSALHKKKSQMGDNLSSKDSDFKESDGIGDSGNIEKPAIVTRVSEEKSQRKTSRKSLRSKTNNEGISPKLQSPKTEQQDNLKLKKERPGESASKEVLSTKKTAAKVSKAQCNPEESATIKSGRKRGHGAKEVSETPTSDNNLDESLVGSRIRVWWPMDKKFYHGVVESYDHISMKHKIHYSDGDVEVLLLKKERWELIKDDNKQDKKQTKDSNDPDASSEEPKSEPAKSSPSPILDETNKDTPKSGAASNSHRKGRPPKAAASNIDDIPSSSKLKERATSKSKDDSSKSGTKLKKDNAKSKDDNSDAVKSTSKTGSKLEDNAHKASKKSVDDTPRSTSSKVRKDALKNKSSEDSPRTGLKSRGSTITKTGAEPKANTSNEKGKAKVWGSETSGKVHPKTTPKAPDNDASVGKKRKRKG